MASERYLVAELWAKQIWVFSEKPQYFAFFRKHPKLFCFYLSNQISLRGSIVFKTNGRIFPITSYKDHCCSFFTSWVIKATKCPPLFWIQYCLWAIFGCWVKSKTVLGVFWQKLEFQFGQKQNKTVLLITQQPNIAQRPFCIQNERQGILYHLI